MLDPRSIIDLRQIFAHSSYDRFTRRAKQILALAQQQALELRHPAVRSEHLLLSMYQSKDARVQMAIEQLGIGMERVEALIQLVHHERIWRRTFEIRDSIEQALSQALKEVPIDQGPPLQTSQLFAGLLHSSPNRAYLMLEFLGSSTEQLLASLRSARA